MGESKWLVVGLGNPGLEYEKTRHNLGFRVIDRLSAQLGAALAQTSHSALWDRKRLDGVELVLAKPMTYMNRSGRSVEGLLQALGLTPADLIVAYDDFDLEEYTLRVRPGGGSGGHLGVASIIEKLETEDFVRVKLGVGRPPGRKEAADYVLEPLSSQELEEFDVLAGYAADAVLKVATEGIEAAMQEFNRKI
ncbi:MAG: aminoacyl-tRNA hydrolase [Candidatus Aquicultorales bacterium]